MSVLVDLGRARETARDNSRPGCEALPHTGLVSRLASGGRVLTQYSLNMFKMTPPSFVFLMRFKSPDMKVLIVQDRQK